MVRPVAQGWGSEGGPRVAVLYSPSQNAQKSWFSFLHRRRQNRLRGWKILSLWWVPLELALVAVVTWSLNLGVRWLADPTNLPIQHLRVVGDLKYLDPNALEQITLPAATGGFLRVNIQAVRQAALSSPWVEDAQVRRLWPDTLRVSIIEQEPVARWRTGGLVNKRGDLFAPDLSSYPKDLPDLGGPQGSSSEMLSHLRRLNRELLPLKLTVTGLQVDERRAWTMTLNNGIQLLLGKNDLDNRLKRFLRVYPSALIAQAERIGHVDLRYSNGFAVGWKHAS